MTEQTKKNEQRKRIKVTNLKISWHECVAQIQRSICAQQELKFVIVSMWVELKQNLRTISSTIVISAPAIAAPSRLGLNKHNEFAWVFHNVANKYIDFKTQIRCRGKIATDSRAICESWPRRSRTTIAVAAMLFDFVKKIKKIAKLIGGIFFLTSDSRLPFVGDGRIGRRRIVFEHELTFHILPIIFICYYCRRRRKEKRRTNRRTGA